MQTSGTAFPVLIAWIAGVSGSVVAAWKCPDSTETWSCRCDFPHTVRCTTNAESMMLLSRQLRDSASDKSAVSLLDWTARNLTSLPDSFLSGVALHGLVLSSGQLKEVSDDAFNGLLGRGLQALALPDNQLETVPTRALSRLPDLERLDLSRNALICLGPGSFLSLHNLTFLDLSENLISEVDVDAFAGLGHLEVVKLKGNRLGRKDIAALKSLPCIQQVDLTGNRLSGPLRRDTLPGLSTVKDLVLAENRLDSVCQDALSGASSLTSLSLRSNLIDVLEDHAFRQLSSLRSLDLSDNRIVAVSEFSLAHLSGLVELDLSHNFLRVLTGDILLPLTGLRTLHLDDNDVTAITVGGRALVDRDSLERFTLSDNPLDCDCGIADFAAWFTNVSHVNTEDRKTAVCATPPRLENALLVEVPVTDLVCGDSGDGNDDDEYSVDSPSVGVSESRVVLRAFNLDDSAVTLLWSVDSRTGPFTCDTLFVYEEMSTHEVLLDSTALRCNSSELIDPTTLVVRLPLGSMQLYHRYRFCVVLLEDGPSSDEMRLVVGCSRIIPLVAEKKGVVESLATTDEPIIVAVEAEASLGVLAISVRVRSEHGELRDADCRLSVTVLGSGSVLARHLLNCSSPEVSLTGLPGGRYRVCASLGYHLPPTQGKTRCVTVEANKPRGTSGSLPFVCFLLIGAFTVLGVYLFVKRMTKRFGSRSMMNRRFLVTNDDSHRDSIKQHSNGTPYVKLHTTTTMTTTTVI